MTPDAPAAGEGGMPACPFRDVLGGELAAIEVVREELIGERPPPRKAGRDVYDRAHRARLRGLAFSGGGIRSAQFNLGVLRTLARLDLLRYFDYLSTVSGGGYISSWLVAWLRRTQKRLIRDSRRQKTDPAPPQAEQHPEPSRQDPEPAGAALRAFDQVREQLIREIPLKKKGQLEGNGQAREDGESPITWLRRFSNYLTPRQGMFSLDTWTAVATYSRNLVLNQTIVVLALTSVLLLPRWLLASIYASGLAAAGDRLGANVLACSILLLLLALVFTAFNLDRKAHHVPRWATEPGGVLGMVILPLFSASVLLALWLPWSSKTEWRLGILEQLTAEGVRRWMVVFGSVYLLFWAGSACISFGLRRLTEARGASGDWDSAARKLYLRSWRWAVGTAFFAGAGGGAALGGLAGMGLFEELGAGDWIHIVTLFPPLVALTVILTAVIHIGLVGRAFSEEQRQWWSRVGAWLCILSLGWLGLFAITFYGAPVLGWLAEKAQGVAGALSLGWILSTAAGVLAGRSTATGTRGANRWLELVAGVAPYVFVTGLLAAVSLAIHRLSAKLAGFELVAPDPPTFQNYVEQAGKLAEHSLDRGFLPLSLTFLAVFALTLVLSSRVDINEFSMHHFYRERLTRAYLGASRRERDENPFTGFDPQDDLPLSELDPSGSAYRGPLPILNATLNLTAGEELAWQERRGASFVFTPRYYGFRSRRDRDERVPHRHAYRPTRKALGGSGVTLGTALAISGAAVSPNMGYHSSLPLAFLMTVFNARLGWWMANPKQETDWQRPGPVVGLWTLLSELFGYSHEDSSFVNLADAAFFENLGIYELVRRRCRFILACDVESDPELRFGGLANAIRKVRSDLGIEVDIDVEPIRRQAASGTSLWHCAVGKIHYGMVDEKAPQGVLVYLKSSLTGDEPEDLLNYARQHPEFPHESTGDQWFDESQFESYLTLGSHAADTVFEAAGLEAGPGGESARRHHNIEAVFVALRQAWHPPSRAPAEAFTRHTEMLDEIFERLRNEPDLQFLDRELYLELEAWRRSAGAPPAAEAGSDPGTDEPDAWRRRQRSAFYLCNSMIQLMENVYLDLKLEREWDHPDHRGWQSLFHHWARSPTFRQTWAVAATTFGARFQKFCRRRLGLRLGQVQVRPLSDYADGLPEALEGLREEGEISGYERGILEKLVGRLPAAVERRPSAPDAPGKQLEKPAAGDVLLIQVAVLKARAADELARSPAGKAPRPPPEGIHFRFTCGIGVVCPAREAPSAPVSPAADPAAFELVFMRLRQHLRNLGLGRQALHRILDYHGDRSPGPESPSLDVEALPDDILRAVYRPVDYERFNNLFRSVVNERFVLKSRAGGRSSARDLLESGLHDVYD